MRKAGLVVTSSKFEQGQEGKVSGTRARASVFAVAGDRDQQLNRKIKKISCFEYMLVLV